ncbi:glycosyl hydrolase family 28-related protein [Sphingomonas sp. KR1UV-12]|uniref:Glycosyl hydrolase family 28-related protein n=2 Tax=Sphingomonas aurea TaxID=3063994 RepID=A0ABT9EK37_9SPHN|nr:glycosyl hydrolase family 28-related protein [Sphingomonas sp. KR1UV-12]MDP1027327.1 glycosyl hydrolase family 28-related protein [Sphingomonas sp. KR1UV-12]
MPAAAAIQRGSVLTVRPNDPAAVVVQGAGDGRTDDTAAIQHALDTAKDHAGGKGDGHGIVFLPSGRYRLTRTIVVPIGVRVFGTGRTRPVLVLGDDTPGFQQGVSTLIVFSGGDQYNVGDVPVPVPAVVPRDKVVRDANSATFYSSMSNVDVEIGRGNPAAAAVRFRVAQHGFLSHMNFRLGSAFAGIYQAGNVMEDVHFQGGRYGIVTEKTSPAWQFTIVDSTFDGQRDAAIREHEVGLTMVNVAIRNTPVAVQIDEGYGDSFWAKGLRLENISKAALSIGNEKSVFTQVGLDDAVAQDVPTLVRFAESGRTIAGKGRAYRVASFSHGIKVDGLNSVGATATDVAITPLSRLPAVPAPAIRALPPVAQWVDVKTLGVKGDGRTDDTAAIQRAIDSRRVLYFPTGFYLVTDTLKLRADTVLLGLHPAMTQFVIPDNNARHAGIGTVVPIVETPLKGRNIVSGLGLFTGRINPRAAALLWRSGADSLLNDVKIMGGGGTPTVDGQPLGAKRGGSGDPVADNRWDAQYPSIWVDGGGGTFFDIWSPNTFASAGFTVTNTRVPGRIYEMSVEHHVRNEFVFDNVENWELLAPQTEQEVGEGMDAVSLEIRNSRNLLFANYHAYRVTRTFHPAKSAVRMFNSSDIRFRNVHVNAESGFATCDDNGCGTFLRASKFPFDDAITDETHGLAVREREFATLDVPARPVAPPVSRLGGEVRKLSDGFWSIGGGAVDPSGALYFVERRFQRILRWTAARGLEVVRDHVSDPVNLAVDESGKLLVLSSYGAAGTVFQFDPEGPATNLTPLAAGPVAPRADARVLVPVNWWNNGEFRDQYDPARDHFTTLSEMFVRDAGTAKTREYVSTDGSLVLPAFRTFQQGTPDHIGWRWSDALNAHGFVSGKVGERVFVTNASENRTYRGTIATGGALTDLTPFAERGGESVATDAQGRVFVANGQVFVYAPDGRELGRIDVPERPLQLLIGGEGGRTLFILTHHALYAAQL